MKIVGIFFSLGKFNAVSNQKKNDFFFYIVHWKCYEKPNETATRKKSKKKTKVWWLGITRPRRSWKCAWHGRLLAAIGCYLYIVWQRWLDAARDAALSMKIALFSFQRTSLSVSRQSALVKEGWEPGSALRARPKLRILMKGSLYEFFFFFLFF